MDYIWSPQFGSGSNPESLDSAPDRAARGLLHQPKLGLFLETGAQDCWNMGFGLCP